MNTKRFFLITTLLLFSVLTFGQKKQGRKPPVDIKIPQGLAYKEFNYVEGDTTRATQMSVTYNQNSKKKKRPVIVFIHGGGWAKGDKSDVTWKAFNVARKGFVGVAINYRLISEAPFPQCIEDVKHAIRFLKSKEGELPIDVDCIGVWGYSAGAHLALMIGLSPEETFKNDAYPTYTSAVKGVMVVSAPTDFVARAKQGWGSNFLSAEQLKDQQFLEKISPAYHVSTSQIPVTMIHGTADDIVKPFHYENFQQECDKKGVKNFKFTAFKDGNHMFAFKRREEVKPIYEAFLNSIKGKTL